MRSVLVLVLIQFLTSLSLTEAQDTQQLLAAVQAYAERKGDRETPMYRHALADLNGDGRVDAVVLLLGDYCGSGGCTMLVFRGTKDGFAFVSGSTITNEPIRVSREKTNGCAAQVVMK